MRPRLRVIRAVIFAHLPFALPVHILISIPTSTCHARISCTHKTYARTSAFGQHPLLTHLPFPPAPLASSAMSSGGPITCTQRSPRKPIPIPMRCRSVIQQRPALPEPEIPALLLLLLLRASACSG
ncbi:hypothetical protein B0H19DRAFT_1263739 [Mycena capillaripes]|nr:hypothetical protein B0H19DRAFT_1263739 [Mycena capillaripes]